MTEREKVKLTVCPIWYKWSLCV